MIEEIDSIMPHWLPGQIRDYLGRYLFSGEDAYKKVSMLSGGERGRLALAKLALQDTNLLLLDEPTNHLDIPSQEVLEAVLDDYAGTILLVTHDRYLVDALATQIWEVNPDENQMTAFNGTYSQMKAEREKEAARMAMTTSDSRISIPAKRQTQNAKSKARPAVSHRRTAVSRGTNGEQSRRDERRRLAQLQELENTIAALEKDLANLSAQLESPLVNANEVVKISKEYERIQKEMDAKLAEWEKMQV